MKYLAIAVLALVLFSCENKTMDPGFTEKWWKSVKDEDYFVRFNDNGEYIKIFEMNFSLPVYMPQIPPRLMQIEGEWSLKDDQIIFETTNIVNDSSFHTTGNDYFSSGYPIGTLFDTTLIRYWTPMNPNDTLSGTITRIDIDTTLRIISPVIWVISSISQDTFKLIINSQLETFSYARQME